MASTAEKKWKLLLGRAAQHITNCLVEQGRRVFDGDGWDARAAQGFTRIACNPKAAKDHIQVLGDIQQGRKHLDQDALSLHITVGLLKEKSGKEQYGGQEKNSSKSVAVRSKPGCE